ncbi:MAG: helix-turn-helix domain-containing protein [Thermodesulfobacteriota bacterium]|nr:helix-turn-helix domain-containing protein [Thermodesulfobacteriota bacterium]
MNRARTGQEAFPAREDYAGFIELLMDVSEIFNMRVAAYCLMANHYHLLIQTHDANLSRCMRHINGVYTQRYNARNGSDGALFRGRYKAILVDGDSYLLELVRYIHRNPLRTGITDKLKDYTWSSHKAYMSKTKRWEWLHKNYILDMFSREKALQTAAYRKFVAIEDSQELIRFYSKTNISSILGSEEFIKCVKDVFSRKRKEKEIPESKQLCPDIEDIKRVICSYYGIEKAELEETRRGVENEARDLAIYLTRYIRSERLKKIGEEFNLSNYSSVSNAVSRTKRRLRINKFKKSYRQILDSL